MGAAEEGARAARAGMAAAQPNVLRSPRTNLNRLLDQDEALQAAELINELVDESRKAGELLATGKAAFCLHWKSLRRQIRVTGEVSKASPERSDDYFASRGRGSRIGAWASEQSRPLESREVLAKAVAEVEERFPDDVPRPPHWGGFMIVPQEIEFWADGEHRLHDRFRFTPDGKGGWDIQRLNP